MITSCSTIFALVCFLFSTVRCQEEYSRPETELSIIEILKKHGFRAESHEVVTRDGYILTLQRVPHGKRDTRVNPKPILMMHGLFGSAENYVIAEMFNSSMAGYFADRGYDVWLGNSRGNLHSRNHVRLDPNKNKFWNFSFHEIGIYDMPAMVDYILKTTGKKRLYYIGHSQGGTVFFILNTMRPEYQKKFIQASLLAPAGFMKHFNNSLTLPLIKRRKTIQKWIDNAKIAEFPPRWFNFTQLLYGTCTEIPLEAFCQGLYNILTGGDPGDFNNILLMQAIRFVPTVAARQLLHFAQIIDSGRFCQWDYGKKKNLEVYGTPEPPDYPIETIQIPIAFYYGLSDNLVYPKDIQDTCAHVPQCTRLYLLPNPKWTHFDFIFSTHLVKELNEKVLSHMDTFKDVD